MNSKTSLFDTSSNQFTTRENRNFKNDIMEETDRYQHSSEETKDVVYTTDDMDAPLVSLSIDEFSESKNYIPTGSASDDEAKPEDENIEMERVMKMNFYKFKSKNQNGIVGMCQKIKKRMQSPN